MPSNAFIVFFDFVRYPTGNDPAAFLSTARSHVNDVIGIFNDIKVMLNDNDSCSMINQSLKNQQQRLHILRMQTDCRFIKNEYRVTLPLPHLAGKLQPLRFAAGKSRCFLAEGQIAEP